MYSSQEPTEVLKVVEPPFPTKTETSEHPTLDEAINLLRKSQTRSNYWTGAITGNGPFTLIITTLEP